MSTDEHEDWLLDAGHAVIEKKAEQGEGSLTALERLTYYFWVADYSMRNAGDLDTAEDLSPGFQSKARQASEELGLSYVAAVFALPQHELERSFFTQFARLSAEIREVDWGTTGASG